VLPHIPKLKILGSYFNGKGERQGKGRKGEKKMRGCKGKGETGKRGK